MAGVDWRQACLPIENTMFNTFLFQNALRFPQLFGRQVRNGSNNSLCPRKIRFDRQAKVHDFDREFPRERNVFWLYVTMDDSVRVSVIERLALLDEDLQLLVHR